MPRLDIVIAGAGIGGLAAALFLARAGHRVTVAERFETPRPIGSGIIVQPTGLSVMDALGLGDELRAHGAPIKRLLGQSNGRSVLDVRYAALGREGLGVHRAALFGILFAAASREPGVSIEPGFEVAELTRGADGRPSLVSNAGRALGPFDLCVDAGGSRSPISAGMAAKREALPFGALWTTVPWPGGPFQIGALEQRYEAARKMVGVLPVGRRYGEEAPLAAFFWSLKREDLASWRARGLGPWRDEVSALWPQAAPIVERIEDPEQLVFAAYGHHTLRKPYGERLAVIGDAAHSTSPQLGQGANMALLDAQALAEAIERNWEVNEAVAGYAKSRRGHVKLYQAMSRLFTPVYQSDGRALPFLRDRLFAPASRLPGVNWGLAKLVAGEIGR